MNKIEKLIKELCPEGVAFKSIGEICKIETGKLNASASTPNGEYTFFTTAKTPSRIDRYRWNTEALLIAGNANVGNVQYFKGKFEAYQRTYVLSEFPPAFNVRFLYFALRNSLDYYLNSNKNVAAMTYIVLSTLESFKVPIPPLEVQQEIVSILDKFTELEAELEAERESRIHELSYFRQKLLDFSGALQNNPLKSSLRGLPLGDLRLEPIGKHIKYEQPTNYIVSRTDYDDSKPTPVLTAGQTFVLGYTDETFGVFEASPQNPVIIFDDFTTAYKWVDFPFKVKSSAMKILSPSDNSMLNLRFLFHCMSVINFTPSEHARHWISNYSQIDITIPPIIQQNKIVSTLDKFIELEVGLAAEIEARARQYEYYRNKLLTFKELKAS